MSRERLAINALDDSRIAEYQWVGDPAALVGAGLFIAEGRLVVRRLLQRSQFRVRSVLVTPPAFDALSDVLARPPKILAMRLLHGGVKIPEPPVYVVDQETMNGIAGFNMHRGCLALAERPATPLLRDALPTLATARRVVILEGVNNPDNVGGIFRSAAAFGADAVIIGPGCSDPLYRKAIRTSMAATLDVPFVDAGPWPEAITTLRNCGFYVVALTPSASAQPLDDLPRNLPRTALLVGAEGDGLTESALAAADARMRIPMRGSTDSLNVTVATSIALYHFSG